MQIQVAEIPEEGMQVDVDDVSWFPGREVSRKGDLRASVHLTRSGERILASGSISLILVLACDRCLQEFAEPKKIDFQLVFELSGEDPALEQKEYECDQGEMDTVFLEKPVIDLSAVLYQQLILALPQSSLCREECLGLCRICGQNLNLEDCGCVREETSSPFKGLGQLLKDKK
ncbi:MAG: DUF177 domain-containing protein [Thermodesulfobacteriota bacterium]